MKTSCRTGQRKYHSKGLGYEWMFENIKMVYNQVNKRYEMVYPDSGAFWNYNKKYYIYNSCYQCK
jgi:hypothetical protein